MRYILLIVSLFLFANNAQAQVIEKKEGWYIMKEFILPSGFLYEAIHLIQPKTAQAEELPLKKRIENWIRHTSDKYGLHYGIFRDVLYCESRLNPKAVGDWRSETKEFMARGVAQFWRRTFEKFKVESKMPELEYENWQDQISLMGWAFSNDLAHHWYNCHKAVRIKYK